MSIRQKGDLLLSMSDINDATYNDEYEVPLHGWNIPDHESYAIIDQQFEEYFEEEYVGILVKRKVEGAYASPRYFDGSDARDEGFSSWITFENTWKRGLGKCTTYTVTLIRKVTT